MRWLIAYGKSLFDGGGRVSRQTALSQRGSPHLFFLRLKVKQRPKITCVLQHSNVREENSCQLIKSSTRARTRLCLGQQTDNELAYSLMCFGSAYYTLNQYLTHHASWFCILPCPYRVTSAVKGIFSRRYLWSTFRDRKQ